MIKYLMAATIFTGLTSWAKADPFYIGGFGGFGMSKTVNTIIQDGQIAGEFPAVGTTTGTFAGIVAGYNQTVGAINWGAEVSAAYDFSRECFSIDCAAERHPGWLLQQVGELGFVLGGNTFAARFGAAERSNNLSAFDLPSLTRVAGGGMVFGPSLGAKYKTGLTQRTSLFITWDHIWWSNYTASTPIYPSFQNTVAIKSEDVFKVGISFRL